MPAMARVGVDTAGGGVILGPGASSVKVNGSTAAALGDLIASHGTGSHAAAVITGASTTVKGDSKRLARQGDSCSCGHTISTGSSDTNAGG